MKKHITIAAGVAAGAWGLVILLSPGIAVADPDIVGMRYFDAKAALSKANLTPVVATVLGGKLPHDQCYVVNMAPMRSFDQSGSTGDVMHVHLSCHPDSATAKNPGFSAGNNSPEAVAVRDTSEKEAME